MQPPIGITDEPKWIRHCCVIYARACEVVDGRIGIIAAARAFMPLMYWTKTNSDPDFAVFVRINEEVIELPVGEERTLWSAHALAREDVKILAIERQWKDQAVRAARILKKKYSWTLEARGVLRREAREASGKRKTGGGGLPDTQND